MKVRNAFGALAILSTVLVTVGLCFPVAGVSAASVLVVNSAADRDDVVVDGVCETSVVGECTLRAALTEANAITTVAVVVQFNIPGAGVHPIKLASRLPIVDNGTAGITIDGFSQPGSSVNTDPLVDNAVRTVELIGTGANGIDGLVILGSHNVVKGLSIHGFRRAIRMTGTLAEFNNVVGNVIGLLPDGSLDPLYSSRVSGASCVDINNGASRNRVGMPGLANRNTISGCFEKGVTFYNQHTWQNYIQNNLIGLDPSGTERRAALGMGIDINWSANGNIVGGPNVQEGNVISGNANSGIEISHGVATINNKVIGNLIGTDPTGNNASPETRNNQVGVRLEGKPDCGIKACPPDSNKQTVTDNVIVTSGWGGILVDKGTYNSTIARNRIGETRNGTVVGNGTFGIRLSAGVTHINVGPGNIIAGKHPGIQINPFGADPVTTTSSPTQYNTIFRNSITTNGLGIDILPYGSVNQNNSGDPKVQQGINVPVLTAEPHGVVANTCPGCTVELFATTGAVGASGPGSSYLASVVADPAGVATFAPAPEWPAEVTATATTPLGSTSEFAQNIISTGPKAPAAPTGVNAVAGTGSATVSFTPGNDNGSPISGYTVTANDLTAADRGGQTVTGTTSTRTITGLANGDGYTFPVTATNAAGTSAPSTPSNAVTPTTAGGVTITSLSPKALGQGATNRQVTVNGSGFQPGTTATINGTGAAVKSVVVTSPTILTLKISIDPTATIGTRDLTVTVPGNGTTTCTACLTINPGPTVTSAQPNTITRGQTITIEITGTNYKTGVTILISGTGITTSGLSRPDATHLRVTLTATATATIGPRDITITNTDGGKTVATGMVTVT